MSDFLRYTCRHETVRLDDHRCPQCFGVMRRCCDSIVGAVPHRESCHVSEERRQKLEAVQ